MKRIALAAIAAATVSTAGAEPELKGSPEELRQFLHPTDHTVTLTGTHEETAYSDKAIVTLVITTEEDRLADSIQANARLRTEISLSMTDAGIDAKEINTSKFSTSPQFGWFGSKPKSFEVVNRMAIGITEESHLQLLAQLADENDEVVMADLAYEHTEKEQFEEDVKKSALNKALAQRSLFEEQLGVSLVPIGFNERPVMPYATAASSYIEEIVVTASRARTDAAVSSEPFTPPAQTFDEVTYQATVYVTFKVIQSPN